MTTKDQIANNNNNNNNNNNDYVSFLYSALYYDNKRSNRFTRVGGGLLYGTSGSRNNSYMKVTSRI